MDSVFYTESIHPEDLLDKTFFVGVSKVKIQKITKTWGKIPIFLAYIKGVSGDGKIHFYELRCMPNVESQKAEDSWKCVVYKKV